LIYLSEELTIEAIRDIEKLTKVIDNILSNPKNWIVSEIKKQGHEVIRVELKPLDVSSYCKGVFGKCNRILMMSATILDKDAFCTSIGLAPEEVKFIQVPSDFPLHNRPINPLNVVYLNYESLHKDAVKRTIAEAIDRIMTQHKDHKGIIHTTSYEQLNFIKENVSRDNRRRLLETDPEVQRDEIIKEHISATKPTVLISPSLHLGLDLKDDLSRFQVITKVPYLSLGDRWINEKRKRNKALECGRSYTLEPNELRSSVFSFSAKVYQVRRMKIERSCIFVLYFSFWGPNPLYLCPAAVKTRFNKIYFISIIGTIFCIP
jgi:ATP-dependent DNA helicase DinG